MFRTLCNELFLLCVLGLLALSIPFGRLLRKRHSNDKPNRRKRHAHI